MIYGYARVSTAGQAKDGNSLEAQTEMLRSAGAQKIFCEHFTGTKKSRPELDKLMGLLKDGDTLVVTKLDRVARSTIHGVELVEKLIAMGVTVNILNMGVMDSKPASRLMRTMFFAFAEYERDMIVERTSEGKAVAKTREGYREGRPAADVPEFDKYLERQRAGEITVGEAIKELGISRTTFYNLARRTA